MNIDAQDIYSMAQKSTAGLSSLTEVFYEDVVGKIAIVTGGATGLGYNVVNRLVEAGAKVVIASRKDSIGKKAEAELQSKNYDVKWFQTDVSKVEDCYSVVDYTVKQYGCVDIVVANAAIWSMYSFLDMPEEAFDAVINTDLKGEYFIAQAAARIMVEQKRKGKIVFISSVAHKGSDAAKLGMMTHYNAAKGAIVSMTKGIAKELRQYGISVNCIAPGGMLTAGALTNSTEASRFYGQELLDERSKYGRETPMVTNPDEVALVVFAMCTKMSDFIVGETIDVDGGSLLSFQAKPWSYNIEGCIPGPKKE